MYLKGAWQVHVLLKLSAKGGGTYPYQVHIESCNEPSSIHVRDWQTGTTPVGRFEGCPSWQDRSRLGMTV